MKKINLAAPFEDVLIGILSLPLMADRISQRTEETFTQTRVKQLLREIYEAANGRQVATTVGLIAIAPPIAPYLKDKPFFVETQADFLCQAVARIADRAEKRFTPISRTSAGHRYGDADGGESEGWETCNSSAAFRRPPLRPSIQK